MKRVFALEDRWFDSIDELLTDFDFERGRKYSVLSVSCSFDIETTSFYRDIDGKRTKQGCMYCWVFGMNGRCVRGRTWNEFLELLRTVRDRYGIDLKHRLIVYVHNLSFEFQWMREYFDWHEVFSVDERKPVYAVTTGGIMFKCSYLLTDMSLDILSRNLTKYKVRKLVGDLDYSLPRTSITPLTDREWDYVLHDGLVVMAYIQEEMERLGGLRAIPNTKTGYVRHLCREACLGGKQKLHYYRAMQTMKLTPDDYRMVKGAFTGGFTHADHTKVGKTLSTVSSYDFTSSYPAVMLSEKFPISSPMVAEIHSRQEFEEYLNCYSCVFAVRFTNIRATKDYEHYISRARCLKIEHELMDNGRVVRAGMIEMIITEQDWFIIRSMYKWDKVAIGKFLYMYRDYLPRPFLDTILTLYEKKTTLKNVTGMEAEYMVSKAMLNSCYGMCVTDICRPEISYDNGEWSREEPDITACMAKYNAGRGRFLYYPWGVWVTAYARKNLFTAIEECGTDYIYADTDSVKILNREKHQAYFDSYNTEIGKKIRACCKARKLDWHRAEPSTVKGTKKPLGVWDYEGTYQRFKTLGAKRYMYEDSEGTMHITIAGVSKKAGLEYLQWKYKTNDAIFSHFNDRLVFPASYAGGKNGSGKLCHTYLDEPMSGTLMDYLGNEGHYSELSGIHLEPTSYDLSLESAFLLYVFGNDPSMWHPR